MLAHRFRQLDCLLTAERRWWQYQPYHHLGIAFAREAPALAKCLAALTLDEIAHLDGDMDALCTLLAPWIPAGAELQALGELAPFAPEPVQCARAMAMYMPGRKQGQIEAFTGCLPPTKVPIWSGAPARGIWGAWCRCTVAPRS